MNRLKVADFETDREKSPLMKELHELGLRHGVVMVVVAVSATKVDSLLIDHRDDTSIMDAASSFQNAGLFLLESSEGLMEFAAAQQDEKKA